MSDRTTWPSLESLGPSPPDRERPDPTAPGDPSGDPQLAGSSHRWLWATIVVLVLASTLAWTGVALNVAGEDPTASAPPPVPEFHPAPVAWQPCEPTGFDCATVTVPLDYDQPGGSTIDLAVKRHRALGSERIGSVFFNPGGPGGSGIEALPLAVADLDDEVLDRFDVVSWDPRGVGGSVAIDCDEGVLDFYANDLTDTTIDDAAEDDAARWARQCDASSHAILPFVGTNDVARDLDVLRESVGDEKLTYIGVSYGTRIGLVYAERFPTHIRAMILDGVVDPTVDPGDATIDQAIALDGAIERFIGWCETTSTCALHAGPSEALDDLQDLARSGALSGRIGGETVPLSPTLTSLGVLVATYDSSTWPLMARAVDDALEGDASLLASLIDAYLDSASSGANAAVSCLDAPSATDAEDDQLAAKAGAVAPRSGPFNVNAGRVCEFWPTPAKPVPTSYRAAGSPPIMVWGTTGDAATPYANAEHVASILENAELVTLDADRHAAMGANDCVVRLQSRYLIEGALPPTGTRC